MRRAVPVTLIAALAAAAPAPAPADDFRDLEGEVEAKLAAVADAWRDRDEDPDAHAVALDGLGVAAAALVAEDQDQAVEAIVEDLLPEESREVQAVLLGALQKGVKEDRAKDALADALLDADPPLQRVMAPALVGVEGEDLTRAYVRLLRERDEEVVLAAVRALRDRGAAASEEAAGPLRRLLREDSLAIRYETARALGAMTGQRPEGYPEPGAGFDTLPDRHTVDRVAFLLDFTRIGAEVAFEDALAPIDEAALEGASGGAASGDAPGEDGGAGAEGEARPELVSAWQSAARAVRRNAAEALPEDAEFHAARFGARTTSFERGWSEPDRRVLEDLEAWLDDEPRERSREVLDAIDDVLGLEPRPQEIYLFLFGLPLGRGAAEPGVVVAAVADRLWGTGIQLHVCGLVVTSAEPPADELSRQAEEDRLGRFRAFCQQLAAVTGGRVQLHTLARPLAEAGDDGAEAAPADVDIGVDLTRSLSSRDARKVEDRFEEAVRATTPADIKFIEAVCACPDEDVVELALEALRGRDRDVALAAARGLARNADPRAQDEVQGAIEDADDPALQIELLRAYGVMPGPGVTAGLIEVLDELDPDPRRIAWHLIAARPQAELAEVKGQLVRPSRDLEGAAGYQATAALAKASGMPAPPATGLKAARGRLLPDRFVASGVAFVVDDQRDLADEFTTLPPREEDGDPVPVSRIEAQASEVERALGAVRDARGRANVIATSGRSWRRSAGEVDERDVRSGGAFVAGLSPSGSRDPLDALEQALEDPAVEQVHLLVGGLPTGNAAGARDPADLAAGVRELNRRRAVPIYVVYVLPAVRDGDARAAAIRKDLLTAMDAAYRPVAEENRGTVEVRTTVRDLR